MKKKKFKIKKISRTFDGRPNSIRYSGEYIEFSMWRDLVKCLELHNNSLDYYLADKGSDILVSERLLCSLDLLVASVAKFRLTGRGSLDKLSQRFLRKYLHDTAKGRMGR